MIIHILNCCGSEEAGEIEDIKRTCVYYIAGVSSVILAELAVSVPWVWQVPTGRLPCKVRCEFYQGDLKAAPTQHLSLLQ